MKILLTTATYPPSQNGVAYQVKLIKDELISRGHKVMVLAPQNDRRLKGEKNVLYFPSIPNPIVPSSYPIGIPIISLKKIANFDPQIIHAHHPIIVSGISKYLAHKHNSALFFTHHTSYEQYADVYLPFGKTVAKKLARRVIKNLSKSTSSIICPSKRIQKHLHSMGIKNTTHIPNGIDTQNFIHSIQKPKQLSLIYVGRLEKEKKVDSLIKFSKSLKEIADFKLTIIGTGTLSDQIKKQVKSYKLTSNIDMLGSIPRDRLGKIISRNHFFVSFSTSEVMPLTHLEALAAGIPILAPKSHGLDFIDNNNSITVSTSIKSANKIVNLYNNSKKYNNMINNIIKNSNNFSIQNSCLKLEKLYGKI